MVTGKKGGLGRGLSALIPQIGGSREAASDVADDADRILHLTPNVIEPNPKQPRIHFDPESLQELAESLRRDGMQEPVIVRKVGDVYQLVSGERRLRAGKLAQLETIPAICREVSDADMLRLGLIENIQREDLNPIEAAQAYQRLIQEFQWTQEELAQQVGKKRVTVTNMLRLLQLPKGVQDAVANDGISMGHARALLAFSSVAAQLALCKRILSEGLSVRQVERLSTQHGKKSKRSESKKDPNIASLEDELRRKLGTKVAFKQSSPTKGKIEIDYLNLDELDRLLALLRAVR